MTRLLTVFHAAALWLILLALPIALAAAERKIVVAGAQSLAPLAEKYSTEFRKTHPSVEIEIRPANSNYALNVMEKSRSASSREISVPAKPGASILPLSAMTPLFC